MSVGRADRDAPPPRCLKCQEALLLKEVRSGATLCAKCLKADVQAQQTEKQSIAIDRANRIIEAKR